MDLREHKHYIMRHPWEVARVKALKLLLKSMLDKGPAVLDFGCGDGYVSSELFTDTAVNAITALDINLSNDQIREYSAQGTNICYMNDYAKISAATYGLILLLDVLEHVNDDRTLLRDITERNLALDGRIVITAPMFQELFASHDAFLGHHRRYSLRELAGLADACGLHIVASGYLFTSLLAARALSTCIQTLLKRPLARSHGVGNWNHGAFITNVVASLLLLDARISLLLRGMNINLPGLTGWIVCEKQRS